ncbi:MAG: PA0069 family radical SAM protein [Betaproteobacteria bacterium]|nr:MAG: PA0069 family radical SAM protein [Betaproteobacteria bacterium]
MDRSQAKIKGRGAADNPPGRFETLAREREPEAEVQSRPETVVTLQRARSIIARNDSPDLPFTQSINPYQGCEHGCIYCYARPSHAYLGLSPGLDFETRIFAKENAAELLRKELSRPDYRCELIALGANTDPYQPVERKHRITRDILEVLWEFRNPVGIVTKGSLIERDLDLLEPMAREDLVQVFVSIGSLDGEIARTLEPRAAAPYRRVETVRRLSAAGVPCGTLVAPIIPFLNDKDMEAVLEAVSEAGACMAGYTLLRLPWEVKDLFKDWLERNYPLKAKHVMARIRDMRGGRDNDPQFGSRMRGEGQYAELLAKRFEIACKRLGLNAGGRSRLDTTKFRRPGPAQEKLL